MILIGAELPPEVLVVDPAADLAAASGVALAGAVGAAFILALVIASGEEITAWQRRLLVGSWGAATLVAAVTAAPAALWGIPIAAALALPALSLLGRAADRRLRDWATGSSGSETSLRP